MNAALNTRFAAGRHGDLETTRIGDTQDKFQEPNSKNQETRRLGDKETRGKRKF
jgi:hypothetical protein